MRLSLPSALPLWLTLARIAAAPIVAALVIMGREASNPAMIAAAFWLFAIAAATDWADGALARATGAVTELGAVLDQNADKILLAATLMAFLHAGMPVDLAVAAIVLLLRDIAVSALRQALPAGTAELKVSFGGKLKTASAMAAAGLWLLWMAGAPWPALLIAARGLFWAAAALALISAWDYAQAALRLKD